jgi:hypothetical protein
MCRAALLAALVGSGSAHAATCPSEGEAGKDLYTVAGPENEAAAKEASEAAEAAAHAFPIDETRNSAAEWRRAAEQWSTGAETAHAAAKSRFDAAIAYAQSRSDADRATCEANAENYAAARAAYDSRKAELRETAAAARKKFEGSEGMKEPISMAKAAAAARTKMAHLAAEAETAKQTDLVRLAKEGQDLAEQWVTAAETWRKAPPNATHKSGAEQAQSAYQAKEQEVEKERARLAGLSEPLFDTENIFIHAGVVTLSPFEVEETPSFRVLTDPTTVINEKRFFIDDSSSTDVNAFVEVRYRDRLAWERARMKDEDRDAGIGYFLSCDNARPPKVEKQAEKTETEKAEKTDADGEKVKRQFFNGQCWLPTDRDVRAGITFGNGSEISGSTVAGSGDFNALIAFGWPLVHRDLDRASTRISDSFNLEALFEVVTDREVQDVHDRESFGIAYVIGVEAQSLPIPGVTETRDLENRVYEIAVRGSLSSLESPETRDDIIVNDTGTIRPEVAGRSFPEFNSSWGYGLDVDVQLPFGREGYLTLGAGVFGGDSDLDPNPWFLRLGITVPLSQLAGIFASPLAQ